MAEFSKFPFDEADQYYTHFEQPMALAWAQAHLCDFMRTHTACSNEQKEKVFLDALEGGLSLALERRERNR